MGLLKMTIKKYLCYVGVVMVIITALMVTNGTQRLNVLKSLKLNETNKEDSIVSLSNIKRLNLTLQTAFTKLNTSHVALQTASGKFPAQGLNHPADDIINVNRKKLTVPLNSNSSISKTLNFLDDYITYPCLQGIPDFPSEKWEEVGKCVRTVNYNAIVNKTTKDHKCVDIRTAKGAMMPICVYPAATDIYVSGNIVRGMLWENDLVQKLTYYIKLQPGVEFLDLGSNLGSYTLSMAHEDINVTAIDPLHGNMELLAKSICLGKVQDKITLIWNAVANHHNIITFQDDKNNIGGTRIKDMNPGENKIDIDTARAITLDDLLSLFKGKRIAIKMDIEESEYNALMGGQRFFDEVDVKVIQMEFMFHKKGKDGPKIIDYLASKGFRPYGDLQKGMPLNVAQLGKWPNDIYFMKPNKN